jgi:hypothetical protein
MSREGGYHDRISDLTTRTRITDDIYSVAPLPYNTWSGSYIGGRAFEYRASLQQVTESEGHPFFLAKRPGYEKMDLGGPFYTEKFKWDPMFPTKRFSMLGWYMEYQDGNIHTISPDQGAFNKIRTDVGRVQDSTLDSWGATAVSSVLPTKSKVDLVTSGVELFREGLPAMVGQGILKGKLKDARKLGDELLNIEFGIKPLLGDIQGTAESIVTAAERIKQLERDSGRLVRRKFRFPDRDEYFHSTIKLICGMITPGTARKSKLGILPSVGFLALSHTTWTLANAKGTSCMLQQRTHVF